WSILVAKGNCNPVDSTHTTFTDRIKSYYYLPVSYSCISIGLAVAIYNTVYAIRLLGSMQVMVHSHSR
ncbi:hypothetical protein, partial [Sphingobacterium sp.]|uniref:hypothetical protein n=1 Tax=Sphingobacterium sp. TaxID=341027 RepID=UPI002FD9ACE8